MSASAWVVRTGALAAAHARRAHRRSVAKDARVKIGTWICAHAQTEYGAFHEIYDIEVKQGADFMCEDLLYCHTTARNAAEMLRLYRPRGTRRFSAAA